MHKQLTYAERYALSALLKEGFSYRNIALRLGRSPNTWNNEVLVNGGSRETYRPQLAQMSASLRKWEANSRNPAKEPRVWDFVLEKLKKRYSPEQISKDIITQYPGNEAMRISHETIYAFINSEQGKEMGLYKQLRHKRLRKLRKTGMRALPMKKAKIPHRISIHDRPSVVNEKGRFGDWESDLMEGARKTKECLSVQKERLSQYLILVRVRNKSSAENVRAITGALNAFPKELRLTLTYDNGTENVDHELVNAILKMRSYFCDAYAAWQKGSIENSIGLVRDYLPKGTDLRAVSDEELKRIQDEINDRPRKCLGWKTPREVLSNYLKTLGVLIPA
jgi:transposase, IS30 family